MDAITFLAYTAASLLNIKIAAKFGNNINALKVSERSHRRSSFKIEPKNAVNEYNNLYNFNAILLP